MCLSLGGYFFFAFLMRGKKEKQSRQGKLGAEFKPSLEYPYRWMFCITNDSENLKGIAIHENIR